MSPFDFPHVPSPGAEVNWAAICKTNPWLGPLAVTPQDPVYHGEGDVQTHTRLVLEALVQTKEWQKLPKVDRGIVFWAALLHDIAKPACTRTGPDGRIQSPNHTIKGECLAREILYKGIPDPAPFLQRERIVKLFRFHGMPAGSWNKRAPLKRSFEPARSSI
jgi:hypothetical protein